MPRILSNRNLPRSRPDRWLRFEEKDRELIKNEVRPWFINWFKRKVSVRNISARFRSPIYQTALWIELHPPYELPKVRRYLTYLGIPVAIIEEMVEFYREHNQTNLPAIAEWLQDMKGMRRWFVYLENFASTQLAEVLSSDTEIREKWEARFRRYAVGWEDVRLTSDTVGSITADLLDEIGIGGREEIADRGNITKIHRRWRKFQTK